MPPASADLCRAEARSLHDSHVGSGFDWNLSLLDAAHLCHESIGRMVLVGSVIDTRPADVKWYIGDNGKVAEATGSQSKRTPHDILVLIGD
jgi:hypothetical protein